MTTPTRLEGLSPQDRAELLALLGEQDRRRQYRQFELTFPDAGPLRRGLYPRHMELMAGGRDKRERCFLAGNRVGKTIGACYEMTCHLTGRYPNWWQGKRFSGPIRALAAGDTLDTTRDIVQAKLLGKRPDDETWGTGMIPLDALGPFEKHTGKPGAVASVRVRHVSGGFSQLILRSYDQGRRIFQGIELDVVWMDEEVPQDVYEEAIIRTMTTDGMILLTFTPLQGMTPLVLSMMDDASPSRLVVQAGWDDVPHLSDKDKREMLAALHPHMREARSKGVPSLGAGALYPVAEEDVMCDPFRIPNHWPRGYGLDVGWNRTAGIWGGWDRDADVVYLYSEHYRGQAEPAVHAAAVKARGNWITGVIDPASRGGSQKDGEKLLNIYQTLGLDLVPANNAVEAGIYEVWSRLSTGRLKVFSTLQNWRREYRLYRRNEKGAIVKMDDHLMDATRYFVVSGLDLAKTKADIASENNAMGSFGALDKTVGY